MADSKHLDFLQAAITRMASNSFVAKGWSITLTTALLGIAVKDGRSEFALIGVVPVLLFAIVDAYYLTLERGFRDGFKVAAGKYVRNETPDFLMSPSFTFGSFLATAMRPAILTVHAPLALILVVAYIRLKGVA